MDYFEIYPKPHVDGMAKAWFSKDAFLNNINLKDFIYGEKKNQYMSGEIPSFLLNIDFLEISPKAKLTDFLSVTGLLRGFVVSDNVKNILEKHNLPNCEFYNVVVHQPVKETKSIMKYNYWWFYFNLETGIKNVDFDKSEFDYKQHSFFLGQSIQLTKVRSFQDYEKITFDSGLSLKANKLVLKSSFDKELDVWGTRFLSLKNYISSRILKEFASKKITGYETKKPICELIFE